jgi:uncharacterized membrane protein YcfT
MGLLKTLIIIVLILLVVGLYYYTSETKDFMNVVGKHTLDVSKKLASEVKSAIGDESLSNVEKEIKS